MIAVAAAAAADATTANRAGNHKAKGKSEVDALAFHFNLCLFLLLIVDAVIRINVRQRLFAFCLLLFAFCLFTFSFLLPCRRRDPERQSLATPHEFDFIFLSCFHLTEGVGVIVNVLYLASGHPHDLVAGFQSRFRRR